jgi:hypothetical protein
MGGSLQFLLVAANPKRDVDPPPNTINDPDDGVTGEERMTGAQASYLKMLSEETREAALSTPAAQRRKPLQDP